MVQRYNFFWNLRNEFLEFCQILGIDSLNLAIFRELELLRQTARSIPEQQICSVR